MTHDLHDLLDQPLAGEPTLLSPIVRLRTAQRIARRRRAVAGGWMGAVAVACAVLLAATVGRGDAPVGPAATPAPPTTAGTESPLPDASAPARDELCPEGTLPQLTIDRYPDASTPGAASVEAAMQQLVPAADLSTAQFTSLGAGQPTAPMWVQAAGATYLVEPAPAGGWFAAPATLVACSP